MAEPKLGQPVSRRLGDLLVREGLIDQEGLQRALVEQKATNEKLGSILVRLNLISDDQLIDFLSKQYGIPSIQLSQLDIDAELLKLVPSQIARKYEVLPIQRNGNHGVSLSARAGWAGQPVFPAGGAGWKVGVGRLCFGDHRHGSDTGIPVGTYRQ